jgi:hypothetical protein
MSPTSTQATRPQPTKGTADTDVDAALLEEQAPVEASSFKLLDANQTDEHASALSPPPQLFKSHVPAFLPSTSLGMNKDSAPSGSVYNPFMRDARDARDARGRPSSPTTTSTRAHGVGTDDFFPTNATDDTHDDQDNTNNLIESDADRVKTWSQAALLLSLFSVGCVLYYAYAPASDAYGVPSSPLHMTMPVGPESVLRHTVNDAVPAGHSPRDKITIGMRGSAHAMKLVRSWAPRLLALTAMTHRPTRWEWDSYSTRTTRASTSVWSVPAALAAPAAAA